MYALFKEEFVRPMDFLEITEEYTNYTVICAVILENDKRKYIPLAITDRKDDDFSKAIKEVKEKYPDYQHTMYINGTAWEDAHPAYGKAILLNHR